MSVKRITVEEAQILLAGQDNVMLLDMRDAQAYCQGHDPRAIHLGDSTLRGLLKNLPRDMQLIISCYHGNASQKMSSLFADFGFTACYSLDGGYEAWKSRPLLALPLASSKRANLAIISA
jgi:thiosulfate sulfurtransferase